jgi:hypothetical protein
LTVGHQARNQQARVAGREAHAHGVRRIQDGPGLIAGVSRREHLRHDEERFMVNLLGTERVDEG